MILASYHTHTQFCDGKNTPKEMIEEAIRLGCAEIGFSAHAPLPFWNDFSMTEESARAYYETLSALRERYKDRIRVLIGIEQDYFSTPPDADYDYVIGSVHYVEKNGVYLAVDDTKEALRRAIDEYYGGDALALAEDYYRLVGNLYEKTHCDVVGHFDLVTKFEECGVSVGSSTDRYIAAANKALDALLSTPVLFEINTGAIARGYRRESYPAPLFREKIASTGRPFVLNSDAHSTETLLFGIEKERAACDGKGYRYVTSFDAIKRK